MTVRNPDGSRLLGISDARLAVSELQNFGTLNFPDGVTIRLSDADDYMDLSRPTAAPFGIQSDGPNVLDFGGGHDTIKVGTPLDAFPEDSLRLEDGKLLYDDPSLAGDAEVRNLDAIAFPDGTELPPREVARRNREDSSDPAPSGGDQPDPDPPYQDRIDLTGRGNIDAGPGLDVGVLEGPREGYTVSVGLTGAVTAVGPETVNASGIERLAFDNGTLAFDDTAKKAYRLYEAAFDRDPDPQGLGYWVAELDTGMPYKKVADSFLISEEFRETYGTGLSDADFVEQLYRNVLDRDPDAEGARSWRNELDGDMSRAGVLASFAQSDENVQNLRPETDDGVFFV
jgi:hypothetical protein